MLLRSSVGALILFLLSGCGDSGEVLYPVHGRVLKNAEPIQPATGFVVLQPDAERGNEATVEPAGRIEPDGRFTVYTNDRSGAPPGWYRVVVTASGPPAKPGPEQSNKRPVIPSLVPSEYGQVDLTPLRIEVAADAAHDAYDLTIDDKI